MRRRASADAASESREPGAPSSLHLTADTENTAASGSDQASVDAEFRRSLLLVLVVDLVVLLAWLGWSRQTTSLGIFGVVALVLPLAMVLALRPGVRRTVALLTSRERHHRHVVIPVGACFVLLTLGLELGERATHLPARSAVHHLGPVDELVVSPNAPARNAALDAISRASLDDPRAMHTIEDTMALVTADGSLELGDRRVPVRVVELDVRAAQRFGRRTDETGLIGVTPIAAGEVVVSAVLINPATSKSPASLSIAGVKQPTTVRPMVQSFAYANLDLFGLAEQRLGAPPLRPVVYVAPGAVSTVASALPDGGTSANVRYLLAVSNVGNAKAGERRSAVATALLQSILASPSAGPAAVPADDPLGLGGTVVSVPTSIEATVVPVKANHHQRIAAELAPSRSARQVGRGALFGASLAVIACSHWRRRAVRRARARTLRVLGYRRRTVIAVGSALEAGDVLVGLLVGFIVAVLARPVVGHISALDGSAFAYTATMSRALTFTSSLVSVPMFASFVIMLVPRKIRTSNLVARCSGFALRIGRRPLPKFLLVVSSAALLIAGLFAGRSIHKEWLVIVAWGVSVLGGAVGFGALLARSSAFGSKGSAIPVLRSRRLLFAAVAAGTGLVLLPVVALQSLEAAASIPGSAWQSVVSVDDQSDAAGLLRQLVPSVGGRVLAQLPLLIEGGRVADASSSALVTAAADGQGDAWMVGTTLLGADGKTSADLGDGIVVSTRLASMHDGGIAGGDRLVLRDPGSGRSLQVTVKAVALFPSWSGDVASSSAVLSTLNGLGAQVGFRSAIAVTPAAQATAKAAIGSLAPLATVSVGPANSPGTDLSTAIGSWLRRVALLILAAAVAVVVALRSRHCSPIRLTLAGAAAAFGWLIAMVVGHSPGLAPVGTFSLGVALAALCGACAYRLAAIGR